MMATEVYELAIRGLHLGEYNECVLTFEGAGVDTNDTVMGGRSLIDGFVANCEAAWLAAFPAQYSLMQYAARRVMPVGSLTVTKSYPFQNQTGTNAAVNGEAQQLCPCITWIPPTGVKSPGKTFLPLAPVGAFNGNAASAGYNTIITTLITALLTAFSNAGISWVKVILSRKLGTWSHAMSGTMSPRIGYQKRRRSPTGAGV